MPRRADIHSILIPGSGPIIIGQACEFDYSGTQACKVLRAEGFRTILVNSNPATIMTDPSMADATYIEPLTVEILEKIIAKERPDALLPTVGGQTALNLALDLNHAGVLDRYGVRLIGASVEAIHRAESREEFKACMEKIGQRVPRSALCNTVQSARAFRRVQGLPLIIRPSFTMGGTGGGVAFTEEEFERLIRDGIKASPTSQILVEESIVGWKEFELEVMRDSADNVVIVCSIENLDPMGVHTGDSITIAPQQTLTDPQYQLMRDAALDIIRVIGVDTGGSNIQFGVNPANGEMVVIEMNPRVSRSSALASKATGFPIAKIAALLAVGYRLDEIPNDITKETPASFEPTIDYVVTKVPRFTFEKFPGSSNVLGSQMKSVGEAMSIGRTFKESFQKAFRSLEIDRHGLGSDGQLTELLKVRSILREKGPEGLTVHLRALIGIPRPERIFEVKIALSLYASRADLGAGAEKIGLSPEEIYAISGIDPWFLYQIYDLVLLEREFSGEVLNDATLLRSYKEAGFSDRQLAYLGLRRVIEHVLDDDSIPDYRKQGDIIQKLALETDRIAARRRQLGVLPVYKKVDTCGGEFEAHTPYLYSSYEEEDESEITDRRKIVILGGGPNRIGQGIEFDYCCCHASFALQELGIESIMINSNPETVSTDYDTSDKLYFEPLTVEDVLHICERERPEGIIVQFGGQTPLRIAKGLERAGVKILGTSPDSIDRAEDRDRFSEMLHRLGLKQPANGFAYNLEEAHRVVARIGFPCLVRPSYVLGGRAMAIVWDETALAGFMEEAGRINPEHPVLIDRFLEDAIELDVDALCDGQDVFVAGIMQHIERAGIHSGDSACVLPPIEIASAMQDEIISATREIALDLNVRGLLNIQFAIQKNDLYIIEVNPRASRTVPFVSKAIGLPFAALATRIICGEKIATMGLARHRPPELISIKEAVLPFSRFPGADIILGPEMKSTGEVMGIAPTLGEAYYKAMIAAGGRVPLQGGIFFSVNDESKEPLAEDALDLSRLGYRLYATKGTADFLKRHGLDVTPVHKLRDNRSPNTLDELTAGTIQVIINIPGAQATRDDAFRIRQEAIRNNILTITTVAGVRAFVRGLQHLHAHPLSIHNLQQVHETLSAP